MEDKELKERIQRKKFFRNNGTVLKAINVLHTKYVKLFDLTYALVDSGTMTGSDLHDSVNYLSISGYIVLRLIGSKVETTLADSDFEQVEAKLTSDGVKIITCVKTDECIDV